MEKTQPTYELAMLQSHPDCQTSDMLVGFLQNDGAWHTPPEPMKNRLFITLNTAMMVADETEKMRVKDWYLASDKPLALKARDYRGNCWRKDLKIEKALSGLRFGVINSDGQWLIMPEAGFSFKEIRKDRNFPNQLRTRLHQQFPEQVLSPEQLQQRLNDNWQGDNGVTDKLSARFPNAAVTVSASQQTALLWFDDNRRGIVNQQGEWLLSPETIQARGLSQLNLAFIHQNRSYFSFRQPEATQQCTGLMDEQGKIILNAQYREIDRLSGEYDLLATRCSDGRSQIIDFRQPEKGAVWTMPEAYAHLKINQTFDDNDLITVLAESGKQGLMNRQGELVLPVRYDGITWQPETQTFALRQSQNEQTQTGLLDKHRKWLSPMGAGEASILPNSPFIERMIADNDGKVTTKYQNGSTTLAQPPFAEKGIELVYGFDEAGMGLARKILPSREAMLWHEGFVNSKGEWLIAPEYSFNRFAHDLKSDTALVIRKQSLEPPISRNVKHNVYYQEFNPQGLIVAIKNGKAGVLNRQGKIVVPFEFDQITLNQTRDFIIASSKHGQRVYNIDGSLKIDYWQAK